MLSIELLHEAQRAQLVALAKNPPQVLMLIDAQTSLASEAAHRVAKIFNCMIIEHCFDSFSVNLCLESKTFGYP